MGPLDLARSAGRHLRIGGLYAAQIAKSRIHYRGDFLVQCAASLATQAVGLTVVAVIFSRVPELRGWSRSEVFLIFGFAITAQGIFDTFADGFYWFADRYVMGGELDRVLLRPVNVLWQILVENLSVASLPDVAMGVAVIAWSAGGLATPPGAGEIALLALFLPSAVLVLSGVFLALASLAFWVEDRIGVIPPIYNLLEFGRYPLTIYRPALRVFLSFVLPFGFVAFYPATGLLGRSEFRAYLWATPAVGLLAIASGYAVFRAGLRRYRSTGS